MRCLWGVVGVRGRVLGAVVLVARSTGGCLGKDELIRDFTLTPADEAFLRKFRRAQNVLGAAVCPAPAGLRP